MTAQFSIQKSPADVLQHLNSIKVATDANRETFGFNPLGAYEDAIAKERLWVAVNSSGKYLGHIMFGGRPLKELRVFQIHVEQSSRGSGIAKGLVDEVAIHGETLSCLNLRADVASDLTSAVQFWQSLGFCALKPRQKKNLTGRQVLIFFRRLSTPSLLPSDNLPLTGLFERSNLSADSYVIDLNIFISIIKKRTDEPLIAQIMQAALSGEFSLFVTPEFSAELKRERKTPDPLLDLAEAALPVLDQMDATEFQRLQNEVRQIIFPQRSPSRKGATQDTSDLRHIAHCIQNAKAGFITNESAILRAKEDLQKRFGLTIFSPQDFKIEHIPNAQQADLSTPLNTETGSVRVSSLKNANQVREFLDTLDSSLQEASRAILKNTARGVRDRKIVTTGEIVCAIYAAHTKGAKHDSLEGFFISNGDFTKREIVFSHLLECFLRHSQAPGISAVALHLRSEDFDLEKCCLGRGFQRLAESAFSGMITLAKLPCPPLVTKSNWSEFRTAFGRRTKIELPPLMPATRRDDAGRCIIQVSRNSRSQEVDLYDLETLLSPSLVLLPGRTGVVLPIIPSFAADLLSRPDDLLPFPLEEEALLRLEKAYFRNPTHRKNLVVGMPIAFYESQNGRGIVGLARITSVHVTTPQNAYKLYQKHGVLSAEALSRSADKSGNVQVITFDNFKEFTRPISLKRLQELGCAKANLVGPEVLSHAQLYQIVHEGMGIHCRDVLISIQPDYVAKILNGKKTIELRKKPFPANGGVRVWIYSTSPTSAIEASAFVDTVECDTPENIWRKFQHKCGISKDAFDDYFSTSSEAYAISIARPKRIGKKLKLDDIKQISEGFTPPQYYRYVDHDTTLFDALISREPH